MSESIIVTEIDFCMIERTLVNYHYCYTPHVFDCEEDFIDYRSRKHGEWFKPDDPKVDGKRLELVKNHRGE
jgi:hypothetical protein